MFENYDKALKYANAICGRMPDCNFSPYDLVHEAYVELDGDLSFFEEVKKKITSAANTERHNTGMLYSHFNGFFYGDQCCIKCKEVLPPQLFRVRVKKSGYRYLETVCIYCEGDAAKAYVKNNKEKMKENFKKWQAANPEKNRARAKAWLDKERAALSDKYIIGLLRGHKSITPLVIEEKRKKVIEKMNKSKNK